MKNRNQSKRNYNHYGHALLAVSLVAISVLLCAPTFGSLVVHAAQQERGGDVVANLAAGRVVFCVTKTAIVVAAIAEGGETGSRAPAVTPLPSGRIGVLLGAMEWNTPASGGKPVRLDVELPAVTANATRRPTQANVYEPSDIEEIGVAVLEQLRPLVDQIHHKLDLGPDEPLLELLLADYVQNYGPEIWRMQFGIRQENLGNDYWVTHVQRPAYYQLYPPEKGQPRTLVEVVYPPNLQSSGLLDRLVRRDPQIDNLRRASPELSLATDLVIAGNSQKALAEPITAFLRAALPAISGDQTSLVMALTDEMRGFQWILAPQEKLPPATTKPLEPGAPSLRRNVPSQ